MTLDEFKVWLHDEQELTKLDLASNPVDLTRLSPVPSWISELNLSAPNPHCTFLGVVYLMTKPVPFSFYRQQKFNYLFNYSLDTEPQKAIAWYRTNPEVNNRFPGARWQVQLKLEELAENAQSLEDRVKQRLSLLRNRLIPVSNVLSLVHLLANPREEVSDVLAGIIFLVEANISTDK